jgi:hypothetical protein
MILVGYTYSYGAGDADLYLIKTDALGFPEWSRTYGGAARDFGHDVCESGDGGFVATGYAVAPGTTNLDLLLLKVDGQGDEVWSQTYGGPQAEEGWSVCATSDGGYLVAGRTASAGAGESDAYLLKTDALGDTLWTRVVGGLATDWGTGCCETTDGGYAISGVNGSYSANNDMMLLKTDATGATDWLVYEGAGGNADWGWSICPTNDGGVVIAGSGDLHGSAFQQAYLAHYDAEGVVQWSRHHSLAGFYEYGWSICPTSDGGYLFAGATKNAETQKNDIYLMQLDADGLQIWSGALGDSASEWGCAVGEISAGNYFVAGHTESYGAGHFDAWLVRLYDPAVQALPEGGSDSGRLLWLEENPFSSGAQINFSLAQPARVSLDVLDVGGRRIAALIDGRREAGLHAAHWDPRREPAGVYYCRLAIDGEARVRKAMLIR